jgi:hypothetical protein
MSDIETFSSTKKKKGEFEKISFGIVKLTTRFLAIL